MLRLGPQNGAQAFLSGGRRRRRISRPPWWLPSPKSGVRAPKKEVLPHGASGSPFIVVVKLIFEALHIARGVSGSLETPLLAPDTSSGKGMHLVWCGLQILT